MKKTDLIVDVFCSSCLEPTPSITPECGAAQDTAAVEYPQEMEVHTSR